MVAKMVAAAEEDKGMHRRLDEKIRNQDQEETQPTANANTGTHNKRGGQNGTAFGRGADNQH